MKESATGCHQPHIPAAAVVRDMTVTGGSR